MKMKEILFGFALTILLVPMISTTLTVQIEQQAEKTVFVPSVYWTPPPAGHWNPFGGWTFNGFEWEPGIFLYEPLAFWLYANDTWIPALATSWSESAAHDNITVSLQQGVKWHDGTTFTSKDVLATFYCSYLFKGVEWTYIGSVEATNDYTVVFNFKKPTRWNKNYALLGTIYPYSQLGHFSDQVQVAIAQGNTTGLDAISAELTDYRPEGPVGTGPYKLKSIGDTEALLEKFPDYWRGAENIYIDEIKCLRWISDAVSDTYMYSGTTDFDWLGFTKEAYEMVKKGEGVRIVPIAGNWNGFFYINCHHYPLSLKEVRQAIAYGTNRTECALTVYGTLNLVAPGQEIADWQTGIDHPTIHNWLPQDWMEQNLNHYEYNPEKAKMILDELDFIDRDEDGIRETPNGTKLEFTAVGPSYWEPWPVAMEVMGSNLAPVGIKITVLHQDFPTFQASWEQGNFDFWQMGTGGGAVAHPYSMFYTFFVDNIYAREGAGYPPIMFDPVVEVPWIGTINVSDYTLSLPTIFDFQEEVDTVKALAYAMNQYLPAIEWYEGLANLCTNTKRITGWPVNDSDPLYTSMAAGNWGRLLRLVIDIGMLKPVLTLTLSISPAEGGTLTPGPGVYSKVYGDTVTVTVTVASGYVFDYWQLDGVKVSDQTTYTVTMDKSHELIARFAVPPPPPIGLYAAIAVVIAVAIAGWIYAVTRKR